MQDNSIVKFQSLPIYIQDAINSMAVIQFFLDFEKRYGIDDDHNEVFLRIIRRLFIKDLLPADLVQTLQTELGMGADQAQSGAREIITNICSPFMDIFGDVAPLIQSLGGSIADVNASPVIAYLTEKLEESIQELTAQITPENIALEAEAFERIFSNEIVHILRDSSDMVKYKLDQSLYVCLANIDDCNKKLADLLLANTENLSQSTLDMDGKKVAGSVGNWLHDYISFSENNLSSINIAKYLGTSPHVTVLSASDKQMLRQLCELYALIRNYPQSLASLPPHEWHFFPYDVQKAQQMLDQIAKEQAQEDENEQDTAEVAQKAAPQQRSATTVSSSSPAPRESQPLTPPTPPTPPTPSAIDYDALADRVIKTVGADIKDTALLQTVRNILIKRIRDIRDTIETREYLMESYEKAGQTLDQKTAIRLTREASVYADMLAQGHTPDFAIAKSPETTSIPEAVPPASPAPDVTVVVPSVATREAVSLIQPSPVGSRSRVKQHPRFGVSGRAAVSPQSDAPAPKAKPRLAIEDVGGVPMIVEKERSTSPANSTVTPSPRQNQPREIVVRQGGTPSPYKVPLMDVKVAPRLMDPVDELRAFTLKDFRRLSNDPQAAVKRIYQKIKLLEKDSASKKVAGINAWKQSEVHSLYTAIGQESFGSGNGIPETIASRTAQGKPVLSEPEFDALMELNEMLRF